MIYALNTQRKQELKLKLLRGDYMYYYELYNDDTCEKFLLSNEKLLSRREFNMLCETTKKSEWGTEYSYYDLVDVAQNLIENHGFEPVEIKRFFGCGKPLHDE